MRKQSFIVLISFLIGCSNESFTVIEPVDADISDNTEEASANSLTPRDAGTGSQEAGKDGNALSCESYDCSAQCGSKCATGLKCGSAGNLRCGTETCERDATDAAAGVVGCYGSTLYQCPSTSSDSSTDFMPKCSFMHIYQNRNWYCCEN